MADGEPGRGHSRWQQEAGGQGAARAGGTGAARPLGQMEAAIGSRTGVREGRRDGLKFKSAATTEDGGEGRPPGSAPTLGRRRREQRGRRRISSCFCISPIGHTKEYLAYLGLAAPGQTPRNFKIMRKIFKRLDRNPRVIPQFVTPHYSTSVHK